MSTSSDSLGDRPPIDLSRHDLVLVAIPLAFALAFAVRNLLSVPVHASVTAAAVVGGLAVVDALFVNPPVTD